MTLNGGEVGTGGDEDEYGRFLLELTGGGPRSLLIYGIRY